MSTLSPHFLSSKPASHLWPKYHIREVKYFETYFYFWEYFLPGVSLSCNCPARPLAVEIIINIHYQCANAGGYTQQLLPPVCLLSTISHF